MPGKASGATRARPGRLTVQDRTPGRRPGKPTRDCDNRLVTDTHTTAARSPSRCSSSVRRSPRWCSRFSLTVDKFLLLANPEADLDCDFSLLVQCGGEPRLVVGGGVRLPTRSSDSVGSSPDRRRRRAARRGARRPLVLDTAQPRTRGALGFVIWLIGRRLYAAAPSARGACSSGRSPSRCSGSSPPATSPDGVFGGAAARAIRRGLRLLGDPVTSSAMRVVLPSSAQLQARRPAVPVGHF